MENKENIFQKLYSAYERRAKSIVIFNIFIEIVLFITCCILFLLFSKKHFMDYLFFILTDKDLQSAGVYKGIALIVLFLSMMYFAYHSVRYNFKIFCYTLCFSKRSF